MTVHHAPKTEDPEEYKLVVGAVYGVPPVGGAETQIVVGHGERIEYVSLHSWPWSANCLFNWMTKIKATNFLDLFVGVCMKDRYDHVLVKFRLTSPDKPEARVGKWCSEGSHFYGSSSQASHIPPQLCYEITDIGTRDDDMLELVGSISSWDLPHRDFADDGSHGPCASFYLDGEISIEDVNAETEKVRGQGSGDAQVNEPVTPTPKNDDFASDVSTGIMPDDSASQMGGPRGPRSAIVETKTKGGITQQAMINPDTSDGKLGFWAINPDLAGLTTNVEDARNSLYLVLSSDEASRDWTKIAPIFQLLRNAGPNAPIRIEELSVGIDWRTGHFDSEYTYGKNSGYEVHLRSMAANIIKGAEMLLDALHAPWQAGWVGGMDTIRDQARNGGSRVVLAALGAWIAKVPKEIIIRTYVRTYVRTQGVGSGVWGLGSGIRGAPEIRTYVRTHALGAARTALGVARNSRNAAPGVRTYVRTYVRT